MDLKLEDLISDCRTCKGTGEKPVDPPKLANGQTLGRQVVGPLWPDPCPDCAGKGYIINENGKVILEFLRRVGFRSE